MASLSEVADKATTEVDVAVVGGGLVGASAALGVAATGRSVLLIDRQQPTIDRGKLGIDIRNVAISPASQSLLATLGVWGELAVAAYRRMR
ncbi:MAG: FAD-dependent monooxygenase, partial [Gammaproteobacteria bacterium]|nr:FAD-dependent monooxygenase [Gammaproteobacteria bacterium]